MSASTAKLRRENLWEGQFDLGENWPKGRRSNPRGMLLLEVMAYVFIVVLVFGGMAGAASLLCHNLEESTQREHQLTDWAQISELLRDDVRGAVRLEWNVAQTAGGSEPTLKLTQPGGRVIEYRVERKAETVPIPSLLPSPAPRKKLPPKSGPAPIVPDPVPATTLVVSPPVLIRSVGDEKEVKPRHRFEWYDIVRVERSKSGGSVWELAELQPGASVDAAAERIFFMLSVEYQAPHKPPRPYSTGAATRLEAGGQR
jgi:hypothetical protein